ncbi:hypothetical protein ACQJBY_049605 [Aegilops geniculata]
MMEEPSVPFAHAAAPIGEGTPATIATAAETARRAGRSRDRRKRRRIAEESGGWASLPGDLVRLVAERVRLDGDVIDYISLRAACSGWRASTDFPRSPQEQYHYFGPGGWVALCDGDQTRPDDALQIAFFKLSTGRRLRARFPTKLRGYRIVSFSGGLLVLVHKRDSIVRLLHPFTRSYLDLPSIAPTFRIVVGVKDKKECFLRMNAAICTTSAATPDASVDVVAWFPGEKAMLWAKPSDATWNAIYLDVELQSVLAYRGRLYATARDSASILQVYPQSNIFAVDTPIPDELGPPSLCRSFLVESNDRMLLAVRHRVALPNTHTAVKIFDVDLDRRQLTPVSKIGDRALFLGKDRCLSVSAKHLPSIRGNSVYISEGCVELYSLSSDCPEHESLKTVCHTRPFTIADHLITYCNHLEWARGLMFHEYPCGVYTSKELKEKVKKQDSQLRIPTPKKTSSPSANFIQYL